MNEVIERAARAMCADLGYEWGGQGMLRPEDYLTMAEAAIKAIREPTEAMLAATRPAFAQVDGMIMFASVHGAKMDWPDGKPPLWHAWQAMIDSALK